MAFSMVPAAGDPTPPMSDPAPGGSSSAPVGRQKSLGAMWGAAVLLALVLSVAAGLDDGLARVPYMAYNTWYDAECKINEQSVLAVLAQFARYNLSQVALCSLARPSSSPLAVRLHVPGAGRLLGRHNAKHGRHRSCAFRALLSMLKRSSCSACRPQVRRTQPCQSSDARAALSPAASSGLRARFACSSNAKRISRACPKGARCGAQVRHLHVPWHKDLRGPRGLPGLRGAGRTLVRCVGRGLGQGGCVG